MREALKAAGLEFNVRFVNFHHDRQEWVVGWTRLPVSFDLPGFKTVGTFTINAEPVTIYKEEKR